MTSGASVGARGPLVVALRDVHAAAAPLATVPVLHGLSFDVHQGEQVALIG